MRKRTLASLIPLVALAWAVTPAAEAKQIESVEVCGSARCVEVHGDDMFALAEPGPPFYGYRTGDPPRKSSPFYRVAITVGGGGAHESFKVDLLPRAGLVRGADGAWTRLTARARRALARATADLPPLPASRLDPGAASPGPGAASPSGSGASAAQSSGDARAASSSEDQETAGLGHEPWPWLALGLAVVLLAGAAWALRAGRQRGGDGSSARL
jgi:hypothetical protein